VGKTENGKGTSLALPFHPMGAMVERCQGAIVRDLVRIFPAEKLNQESGNLRSYLVR
jgi:hypothetical protein